ncbi:MAG TPA: DNA alkylation repair protein [Microbacteriaceae bacterium]|nr:DNA alkylation repair protein [Microbacteriaceae bacterium]
MASPETQTARAVMDALSERTTPGRAEASAWFFKTGPGEYGEGDRFIGVAVPEQRRVARSYRHLPLEELDVLLDSPVHEHRLTGVLIAVEQFRAAQKHGERATQEGIVDWYRSVIERGRVNNWDIVDSSAPHILGAWLVDHPSAELHALAQSHDLWKRRIAMLSTLAFITRGNAKPTLELLPLYLDSREDLLQKASGWMLREIGKRVDVGILLDTLEAFAPRMPRVMLSYATEHLSPDERAYFRSLRP